LVELGRRGARESEREGERFTGLEREGALLDLLLDILIGSFEEDLEGDEEGSAVEEVEGSGVEETEGTLV
jgi:hypothetical protein